MTVFGWYGPWVAWGVACAVLVFWSMGAYNRLMRLRARMLRIFGTLAEHGEGYAAWVAERAPQVPPQPGDPWASLQAASVQFTASLAAARAKPMDMQTMAGLSAARTVLLMAWQHLDDAMLVRGRGEDDVASRRASWEAITAQAQSITHALSAAVQAYNQAVAQFPAILLAWVCGFRHAHGL